MSFVSLHFMEEKDLEVHMKISQQILSALILAVLLTGCDTAEEIAHPSAAIPPLRPWHI